MLAERGSAAGCGLEPLTVNATSDEPTVLDPEDPGPDAGDLADSGTGGGVVLTQTAPKKTPDLWIGAFTAQQNCSGCALRYTVVACNLGTGPSNSFVVSVRFDGGPPNSCPRALDSLATTPGLAAGDCRDVTVYGPGYVGRALAPGNQINSYAVIDSYCAIAETNEGNNVKHKTFTAK